MTEPQFIFVYGLLMRGFELHHHMEAGTFVGEGQTDGVLLSLGSYPGLIDGAGSVRGELYRFNDLPAALDVLDDVEEFDATDPDASLYLRVARQVRLDDGRDVAAWTYLYNRTANAAPRIKDGHWRAASPPARER
jgi:gamma-glutamylcyclotransferase (GGCT)/AIG2-like uncharacterized protein YtfP